MINEFLTVLFDQDYSEQAKDYLIDTFSVAFTGTEFLSIGYRKKFSDIYIKIKNNPTPAGAELWQYFNGTSWVTLPASDESKSLTVDGFLLFTPPTDWVSTTVTVGGVDYNLFFIRIQKTTAVTIEFNGINTIFANDNDLQEEYRNVMQFLVDPDTTFIATHQSVKKDIVQNIRNKRNAKYSSKTGTIADITVFDLLERDQLRRAGCYWALSKIFYNVSANKEDKFFSLSAQYFKMGSAAIETYLLFLDKNDDGEVSASAEETTAVGMVRIC